MRKVLIVDDIEVNRKLLARMLSFIGGFQVVPANDGLHAIELYNKEQPDLVLMDINMPEMNGYQAAKIIKESTLDTYTPIIFITALTEETSLIKALDSGGDDFISKPLSVSVLESKIKAHLRIKDLNEELRNKNKQISVINRQLTQEQALIKRFFDNAFKQNEYDKELVKFYMSPMSTFNGDLILVEKSLTGDTFILIGDAIGHGITAAMVTLPVVILFFDLVRKSSGLNIIASELNQHLNKVIPLGMFLSASIIQISKDNNKLSIWAGGLPESYMLNAKGEFKGLLQSRHLPLGILKEEDFEDTIEVIAAANGDKFYFYSDGVIEAQNNKNEMFGEERLKRSLLKYRTNRFEQVLGDFQSYTENNEQNDDITLLEINFNQTKNN